MAYDTARDGSKATGLTYSYATPELLYSLRSDAPPTEARRAPAAGLQTRTAMKMSGDLDKYTQDMEGEIVRLRSLLTEARTQGLAPMDASESAALTGERDSHAGVEKSTGEGGEAIHTGHEPSDDELEMTDAEFKVALTKALRLQKGGTKSHHDGWPKRHLPPKFSGEMGPGKIDYNAWSLLMKNSMPASWRALLEGKSTNPQDNEELYGYLTNFLEPGSGVFMDAQLTMDDGVALWKRLQEKFNAKTAARVYELNQQLQGLKWKDDDDITKFGTSMLIIRQELLRAGGVPTNGQFLQHMVQAVPEYLRYEVVQAIKADTSIEQLILELKVTESAMGKAPSSTMRAPVHMVAAAATQPTADESVARVMALVERRLKDHQPRSAASDECYRCGRPGHIRRDCHATHHKKGHKLQADTSRGRGRGRGGRGGRGRGRGGKQEPGKAEPTPGFLVGANDGVSLETTIEQLQTPIKAALAARTTDGEPLRAAASSEEPRAPSLDPTSPSSLAKAEIREDAATLLATVTPLETTQMTKDTGTPKATVAAYDTCSGRHIFNKSEYFTTMTTAASVLRVEAQLQVANGVIVKSRGIGTVQLHLTSTNGKVSVLTLRNVHYVPEMVVNLISSNLLLRPNGVDSDGTEFSDGKHGPTLVLPDGETITMQVKRGAPWLCGWTLQPAMVAPTLASTATAQPAAVTSSSVQQAAATSRSAQPTAAASFSAQRATTTPSTARHDDAPVVAKVPIPTKFQLLHADLGHPHIELTKQIAREMGIPFTKADKRLCVRCAVEKASHAPITSTAKREPREPGDIVHLDAKGPMLADYRGRRFTVLFTDEATRFSRVYFTATKTEFINAIQQYIVDSQTAPDGTAMNIERRTTMHTDNDSNFLDDLVLKELAHHHIKVRTIPPHTPQRNGIAERKWRTVFATARALLRDANMTDDMWSIAVQHAVFLRNLLPTKANDGLSPFQALTGRKPNYAVLRRFGSDAYVVDEGARQMEPRARKGRYVGHSVRNNSPLVFFADTKTIVSSIHLRVDELQPMQIHEIASDDGERDIVFSGDDANTAATTSDVEFPEPTPMQTAMLRPNAATTYDVRIEGGKTILTGFRPPTTAALPAINASAKAVAVAPPFNTAAATASPASTDTTATTTPTVMPATNAPLTTVDPPRAATATTSVKTASELTVDATRTAATTAAGTATEVPRATAAVTTTRSGRTVKKPATFSFAVPTAEAEPRTYEEAEASSECPEWMQSIKTEDSSIAAADTWDVILRTQVPPGSKILPSSYKFKKKLNEDGSVEKYKARLCVGGHMQRPGLDYDDVYAPVMTSSSFRTLLSIAASKGMEVHQMDAVSAFLNGKLPKPIYIYPPPGASKTDENGNEIVYKLKKALYGLHEAPRAWNDEISKSMSELGLKRSLVDPGMYAYVDGQGELAMLIGLWVDDLVIAGYPRGRYNVSAFKQRITARYKMIDKGPIKWCLGMSVSRTAKGYTMDQGSYVTQVLKRFNMCDAKPTLTPFDSGTQLTSDQCPKTDDERHEMANVPYAAAVGCLIHLSTWTRPDIAYQVGVLSRFMANPGRSHWKALQHVLRYLNGTRSHGLSFTRSGTDRQSVEDDMTLRGFVDASWANDVDERRSTSGYVMMLANGPVAWSSKRQAITAASTAEAEYIAASVAVREVVYLRQLLAELGFPQESATVLHEDNQPCIHLANNPATSSRTKHIDIRYHIVRERVSSGEVELRYIPTRDQLADMLTKCVPGPQLTRQRGMICGRSD